MQRSTYIGSDTNQSQTLLKDCGELQTCFLVLFTNSTKLLPNTGQLKYFSEKEVGFFWFCFVCFFSCDYSDSINY